MDGDDLDKCHGEEDEDERKENPQKIFLERVGERLESES